MVRRLLTQMLLNLRQILTAKDTIASPTTTANCVHATITTAPTITITKGMVPFFKFTTKLGTERYSHATRLDSSGCLHAVIVSSLSFPPSYHQTCRPNQSINCFFLFLPSFHKTQNQLLFCVAFYLGLLDQKLWKSLVDLIKGHWR